MTSGAVIYEVRLRIDDDIVESFDAWLPGHIDDMLRCDGFEAAETIRAESDNADTNLRIVRYRVTSRDKLQDYLDQHAAAMRAEGLAKFGERFSATRDIYPAGAETIHAAEHRCRNCAAPLRGQYCAECGQRDKHRIISLWALLRDVIGDLFEIDSRVWRTLLPLVFKPGHLTREYLRGRQVRYTPPFRLYLVTSLFFFLVAFFGADNAEITFGDDELDKEQLAEVQRELDTAIGEAGAELKSELERARAAVERKREAARTAAQTPAASPPPDAADDATQPANSPDDASHGQCADITFGEEPWQKALETRARAVCGKLTAEGGAKRFVASLVDNLPGTMFVFLPFIALVMKLLYPLARRFYVEHLLFVVHFHSFFFLALTISVLVSRLPAAIPGQQLVSGLLTAALVLYTPIYLFVAMRRVYGQHFLVTTIKFTSLMGAYFISLITMFVTVVLFTALSL